MAGVGTFVSDDDNGFEKVMHPGTNGKEIPVAEIGKPRRQAAKSFLRTGSEHPTGGR